MNHPQGAKVKNFNPYLTFEGNCREAMEFYRKILNGEIVTMQTFAEAKQDSPEGFKDKIIHAELKAEGVHLMASDGMPGWKAKPGNMITLNIDLTDSLEQEKIFRALSEGGVVTMPLNDTFWGARYGMLTDRYGIQWMLNYQKQPQPA